MGKKRNKKKTATSQKDGVVSMDTSCDVSGDAPQVMDTSEGKPSTLAVLGAISKKIKNGIPTRRSKNIKKQKALARAICNIEKSEEKVFKSKSKTSRTQSAKSLYD